MKSIVNTRNLHESARKGIISLIPKKGCDLLYVKNWRPIILLKADYKLFSKILATRLQNILDTIIHKDQMGFMPGRNISYNLQKTLDTITYVQKRKIDVILISLDFEKAFNRLEYKSLYGALKAFGIPQEYIDNIELLFTDFKLATVNGGFFSDWFSPSRGVFQGNCISPYAFVTVIEILSIRLRQNVNIKGIEINGLINMLTQFADDMQMFMKFSKESLQATIDELTRFEDISGMKVHYDKTAIYRIGSLANSNAKLYISREFQWTSKPLVILGLEISNDESQMYDNNYTELFKKVENVLHCWQMRSLSICGKIQVLNSLVASLFVYKLSVFPCFGQSMVKRLDKLFNSFIWDNKRPKVKLETLAAPRDNRRLGLVNMKVKDQSLKLQWIKGIMSDPVSKMLAYELMGNKIGDLLWKCQFAKDDIRYILPQLSSEFWKDIVETWADTNFNDLISSDQVLNQILWYNSNERKNGIPFCINQWRQKGILHVKDLLTENGNWSTFREFCDKYSIDCNFVDYYGLLHCIPQVWKQILKVSTGPRHEELFDQIMMVQKPVRWAYNMLFKEIDVLLRYFHVWQKKIDVHIRSDDLMKSVKNIWSTTIIPKLRGFQYKIITNTLITNVHLFYFKICDDKMCSLCNHWVETTSHIFCECIETNVLLDYVKVLSGIGCSFNNTNILLNFVHDNPLHPANMLILLYKYFIYTRRCMAEKPNLVYFRNYISKHIELEKQIAIQNAKLSCHNIKWGEVQSLLR